MSRDCVLLLASRAPDPARLTEVARRLADLPAVVVFAAPHAIGTEGRLTTISEAHAFIPAAAGHGPAFRRELRAAKGPERFQVYASHDQWLRERLRSITAVLALDPTARTTIQGLVHGRNGLIVDSVAEAEAAIHSRRRTVARVWRRFVRQPLVASDASAERYDEVLRLVRADDQRGAERLTQRRIGELDDARQRADALGVVTHATLARAREPGLLIETVGAELEVADSHLAISEITRAADSFEEAMRTAFHRGAHLDGLRSPLAADPPGFARPLRRSAVMRELRSPRGRTTSPVEADGRPMDRPRRYLLATWANANFLSEIQNYLEQESSAEVRRIDLREFPSLRRFAANPRLVAEEILSGKGELTALVAECLLVHLKWADAVFIDWFTVAPAFFTLLDPGDTQIIVRLHSVEAFTFWPHLVDYSRIDDVIFVSAHLRDLATASVPGLSEQHAPRLHVLPLALELSAFNRPKAVAEARFNLGLVGWSAVAKDPSWALRMLRLLRSHDERYRLHLFGSDFDDKSSPAAERYGAELWPALAELEASGAVVRRGHTDDVPGALQEIGVILSTSVREGCHTAVIEGAASGAVPVVRDWPFFAGMTNGPRTLYPAEWIVRSPEEAVDRILSEARTEGEWRRAAASAKAEAFVRWDWQNVKPRYDELLLRTPRSVG